MKMMSRTSSVGCAFAIGVAVAIGGGTAANADAFPGKQTINLVSWSAAGSPKDVMAREVAKSLKKQFGWNIVVTDITGGGGAAAMHYMLSRPADGVTLIAASGSMELSLQTSLKSMFSVKNFDFVSEIQTDPFVLVVKADSPIKTMDEFEARARQKALSVAGFGADSDEHLVAASLAAQHKFSITWIPYSGGSKAVTALLGGNVDAVLTNLSQVVPLTEADKLRILGVTTAKALKQPPALSFASMGFKDMERSLWRGFVAKAGTDEARLHALSQAFQALPKDPDYVRYVKKVHIGIKYLGPEAFRKEVDASMQRNSADLKLLGD